MAIKLEPNHVKAIEHVLNAGDRVEIIPSKESIKVNRVKLEKIEQNK